METKKLKRMRNFAIIGFIGGLMFAIGDLLIYLMPHYLSAEMYNDLAQMNMWRLAFSLYLGCFGGIMLSVGFYSLYNIAKTNCSIFLQKLLLIVGLGIMLTPLGHFIIACLSNMTFKLVIDAGIPLETAKTISGSWFTYINPVKNFIMVVIILLQSIMSIIFVLREKINCPKWMVILNPLVMVIISIPLLLLLKGTEYVGITEALESFGEGLIYIPVYFHWNSMLKK